MDHKTLETIRLMAVERVNEGEDPSEVIAAYGFCRTTIYKWIKIALDAGEIGLRSTQGTGRPRTLTSAQEQQVFRWVNGRDPRQYGLDFGLWTRMIVSELIDKKFGVRLGVTAVGTMLARLGLTPQKPLQRAYQRDPEAIERWQRETFPGIARQAKQEGGEVFFWDESGFRADTVHGKTWGVRGETPVVHRPGQRQSVSAASAVNAKGAFWFCTYQGGLNGELFVALLKQMMRHRRTPVHMVVDGLPAHRTAAVKRFVAGTEGKLTLHFLPGYAPELNPRRTGMESHQAHRNGKAPAAQGRNAEGTSARRTGCFEELSATHSFIL